MDPRRELVVKEAETWLGTPYHHEARVKGAGVDCGQILIAVYSKFNFLPADYKLEHYPPDFAMHRDREWYLSIVQEFARPIDESEVGVGDIVLYKWGRLFSHGAIITNYPEIIHSMANNRKVTRALIYSGQLAVKEKRFFSPFED